MKNKFRSVAIYCHHKPSKEKIEKIFIRDLVRFLHQKGVKQIHGDLRTKTLLQNGINLMNNENKYDLKIGIGGDGTLLKMIRDLQKKDGIFVGINFGTLGFLSELSPDNAFEGLRQIFNGKYEIDERQLIKSFVYRKNEEGQNKKIFSSYSLNEVVFGHGGLARITNFSVKAGRRSLSTYRGDGLIFATPTGSTAYSMSAGGPILHPSVSAIIVTPVAPHALTHRPIVLPNDQIIHLKFDSRADTISMTIDGQIHFTLKADDEVSLQKATRTAKFVRTKKNYYFKTLRNKLNWGS